MSSYLISWTFEFALIASRSAIAAESDRPTSRLSGQIAEEGRWSNRSRVYGRLTDYGGTERGHLRDGSGRRGRRNVESERENYVSWWRERTPGRLSWAHASLVLLGSPQREDCLCLGALLQSTLGRPPWCSSWSSPALVTVAAVSSHERTFWRKLYLSSRGCEPFAKTL